jgi:hypothetical protein
MEEKYCRLFFACQRTAEDADAADGLRVLSGLMAGVTKALTAV